MFLYLSRIICFFSTLFIVQNNFAQQSNGSSADAVNYGQNNSVGRYVNTRGIQVYYEVYGEGSPLLLIHGNGGSIDNFRYQIPHFSKNYKVIVPDSRSQGNSIDKSDSLSYEMMADDLNALLDSLHIDSCYVIGASDGGISGLLLSIRHPEKVKRLAITGANLWPDTTALLPAVHNRDVRKLDSLMRVAQTAEIRNKTKLLELTVKQPNIQASQLNKIKCITLVIAGDRDIIKAEHTLLIYRSIPNAYLWIVPDSGHVTLWTHKDLFNQVVTNFLAMKEKGK